MCFFSPREKGSFTILRLRLSLEFLKVVSSTATGFFPQSYNESFPLSAVYLSAPLSTTSNRNDLLQLVIAVIMAYHNYGEELVKIPQVSVHQ